MAQGQIAAKGNQPCDLEVVSPTEASRLTTATTPSTLLYLVQKIKENCMHLSNPKTSQKDELGFYILTVNQEFYSNFNYDLDPEWDRTTASFTIGEDYIACIKLNKQYTTT